MKESLSTRGEQKRLRIWWGGVYTGPELCIYTIVGSSLREGTLKVFGLDPER